MRPYVFYAPLRQITSFVGLYANILGTVKEWWLWLWYRRNVMLNPGLLFPGLLCPLPGSVGKCCALYTVRGNNIVVARILIVLLSFTLKTLWMKASAKLLQKRYDTINCDMLIWMLPLTKGAKSSNSLARTSRAWMHRLGYKNRIFSIDQPMGSKSTRGNVLAGAIVYT